MTSIIGLTLEQALEQLAHQGIVPDIVFSMPQKDLKDIHERTARVVRFQSNQLLCSYFRDIDPEANACQTQDCPDT
ncbi:MAG: hypothetical protein GXZ04_08190 [Clostridiales bacterium]|nr:hypothetical protein [Clostridiales bacterium]